MNEKKPSKAMKAATSWAGYIYDKVFQKPVRKAAEDDSGPVVFCGKLTIEADQCCLEALAFVVQAAICAGVLDPNQQCCLGGLIEQIGSLIPLENRKLMAGGSRYAARRLQERQQKKLFAAAISSPSTN